MHPIKMVDLHGQYHLIKAEVDAAIQSVLESTDFIQGEPVRSFEQKLSRYLGGIDVISCGNGTDALQIAMMALEFKPGDEIILPVHTYVATAEVMALLKLNPVFVDVMEDTFTLDIDQVEKKINSRTVAIVPVHLYGQCANMEPLLVLARQHNLSVIEDAAQALGASYQFSNGQWAMAGTMSEVGTTSFFPSKNLGAYGDGGALFTKDHIRAERIRMIANHGQRTKYQHDVIGVNSRLDTLQAAVLDVKLTHLNSFERRRKAVADYYDVHLAGIPKIILPVQAPYSTHVFHQYTLKIADADREAFRAYLSQKGIPSMIYYPIPLHLQPAFRQPGIDVGSFPISERLSRTVLSLPIHTEMEEEQLSYICNSIRQYFQ